jgi:hypothetical protein
VATIAIQPHLLRRGTAAASPSGRPDEANHDNDDRDQNDAHDASRDLELR